MCITRKTVRGAEAQWQEEPGRRGVWGHREAQGRSQTEKGVTWRPVVPWLQEMGGHRWPHPRGRLQKQDSEQSDRGGGLEAEWDGDPGVGVRTKQGGLPVGPVRDP